MIADNIVHFARVLRGAGMAIGPDRVLAALAAVELVGLQRRDDVHAALSAVMLERHEQQPLFDAAFDTFWRDPKLLEQMMYLLLPKISGRGDKQRMAIFRCSGTRTKPSPRARPTSKKPLMRPSPPRTPGSRTSSM